MAISNKVRGRGPDGIPRWLALDGRPIFKSNVAASETTTRASKPIPPSSPDWSRQRPATERGKRPVREIVDIPTDLCDEFSSRRVMINDRSSGLADGFKPTTFRAHHHRSDRPLRARQPGNPHRQTRTTLFGRTAADVARPGHRRSAANKHYRRYGPGRTPKRRHVPVVTDEWIARQANIVVEPCAKHVRVGNTPTSTPRRSAVYAPPDGHRSLARRPHHHCRVVGGSSLPHARIHDGELSEPAI